jgi:hypothetical protein
MISFDGSGGIFNRQSLSIDIKFFKNEKIVSGNAIRTATDFLWNTEAGFR